MKKIKIFFPGLGIFLVLGLLGCATIKNTPATIVGYSVYDLEKRRATGDAQVFDASFVQCYQAVLRIAKENQYTVFYQSLEKSLIVLMDVPHSVNTTEVGVFFQTVSSGKVKVEITSRSSFAQKIVSDFFYSELQNRFPKETNTQGME